MQQVLLTGNEVHRSEAGTRQFDGVFFENVVSPKLNEGRQVKYNCCTSSNFALCVIISESNHPDSSGRG
jgi:hypothetical protein